MGIIRHLLWVFAEMTKHPQKDRSMKFVALVALVLSCVVGIGGCGAIQSSTNSSGMPDWYAYHHNQKPPASVYIVPEIIPVYLDTHFTSDELDAIGGAISEWNL